MRIAHLSPLPPQPTGVADYCAELWPYLSELAEVDLFSDALDGSNAENHPMPVRGYESFSGIGGCYEAAIYHLGNDLSHEHILHAALRSPSFIVLHDVSIHPLLVALSVGRGDLVAYIREMGYAYGRIGVAHARAAYAGHYYRYDEFPLCQRVVDVSLGVIVHSNYAASMVRGVCPQANLAVVPQGMLPSDLQSRVESRQRLGLDTAGFVVAALGLATPNKRLEPALKAFARLRESRPDARLIVAGEVPPWYDLASIAQSMNLGESFHITGRVPLEHLYLYAAASDVCLALRYPTAGETSSSLLRIMAVGRPVIVSNVGSFAEVPYNTCLHVPVGDGEEEAILEALEHVAADSAFAETLGGEARAYIAREHSWRQTAEGYINFIRETLGRLYS